MKQFFLPSLAIQIEPDYSRQIELVVTVKHFWLFLIIALIFGSVVGWSYNYITYGTPENRLGAIRGDGSVSAETVMEVVSSRYSKSLAKVELLDEPTYNFGVMAPNAKGQHTFRIKNIGEEPLTLELGATTCKCTLGELKDSSLAPGEQTSVELEWTVSGDKIEFNQKAQLRTNDPAQVAIDLVVTGTVLRDMEIEPKELVFGSVPAGDPFEIEAKIYSYLENRIEPIGQSFGSEELTELADFTLEPFVPGSADGVHEGAKQGFKITAKIKPGLRQGAVETNHLFKFQKLDENGDVVPNDQDPDGNDSFYFPTATIGRVVGYLRVLEGPKVRALSGGGFVYEFGKLGPEDSLVGKAFIALKGSEKDNTNLTIGESYPDQVIKAELGDPVGRGSMKLFPLTLEVAVGDKPIDLMGKSKDDFGWVWIESDNPKVGRMRLAVKVAADARP